MRFYATGATSQVIGDTHGISKSSVVNIIHEVSYLICLRLKNRFIRMPTTEMGILRLKAQYYQLANFPLCIACTDGTQIECQSFGGSEAETYRNRKDYFSINTQVTCSADVSISSL